MANYHNFTYANPLKQKYLNISGRMNTKKHVSAPCFIPVQRMSKNTKKMIEQPTNCTLCYGKDHNVDTCKGLYNLRALFYEARVMDKSFIRYDDNNKVITDYTWYTLNRETGGVLEKIGCIRAMLRHCNHFVPTGKYYKCWDYFENFVYYFKAIGINKKEVEDMFRKYGLVEI